MFYPYMASCLTFSISNDVPFCVRVFLIDVLDFLKIIIQCGCGGSCGTNRNTLVKQEVGQYNYNLQ